MTLKRFLGSFGVLAAVSGSLYAQKPIIIAAPAESVKIQAVPGGPGAKMSFQMPGAGENSLRLLENADVQKDLKVTKEEKANLALLKDEVREGDKKLSASLENVPFQERMPKLRDRAKEIDGQISEVLGDKFKRFKEIRLQVTGLFMAVMTMPEVKEALKWTDEQGAKVRDGMNKVLTENQPAAPAPGTAYTIKNPQEFMQKMESAQTESMQKVMTDEQKAKWKELTGEPITFKKPSFFGLPGGPMQGATAIRVQSVDGSTFKAVEEKKPSP
jgi:hypothetical protein